MAEEKKETEAKVAEEKTTVKAAIAAPKKAEVAKKRRPQPIKRHLQNIRKNAANRAFKAKVNTALRALSSAIEKKEDQANIKTKKNLIYSLMDKGTKKGIFKKNKTNRVKSKIAAL